MASSAGDAKRFISAQELHDLSEDLAEIIAKDGFRPTFLIALWRGGCYPGMVVQEFLEYAQGTRIDHVAVRTQSRDFKTGAPLLEVKIHAVGHALATLQATDRLLIIDDVWDSGRSGEAVLKHLREQLGPRMPSDTRFGTLFYKPKRNRVAWAPEYYVQETDAWLVFPHELTELNPDEVARFRPRAFLKASEMRKK